MANTVNKTFFIAADPDATLRYFKTEEIRSPSIDVVTAAASTTLTTGATQDAILTANAIAGFGDEVTFIDDAGAIQVRSVLSKGGGPPVINFVISGAAVTVTGKPFTFRPVRGGTTAADGWHDVSGSVSKTVQIHCTTKNSTSILAQVEGKLGGPGSVPTILASKSYSATGGDFFPIPEDVVAIRVGLQTTGDASGDSISAWVNYTVHP